MPTSGSRPRVVETGTGLGQRAGSGPLAPEKPSAWDLGGLSGAELIKRVWQSINDDDVFGRSAQLAYYFFLAVFPALIFATALFGIMAGPGSQLHQELLQYLARVLPPDAYSLVQKVLNETSKASSHDKLVIGVLGALWPATSGMVAVEDTLNAVYDVKESRPIWKAYGAAAALAVVCGILAMLALAVILYGTATANFVGNHIGLSPVFTWTWRIAQWPIVLLFLVLIFSITYYYAPNVDQRHWKWMTPGAVVGIVAWLAVSFGFRVYLHYFNHYSATYGSLGAAIILLTWFYISGLVLLAGAEVNAEIENAAAKHGDPEAKEKGRKRPAADLQKRPA
jgi:membrane protein